MTRVAAVDIGSNSTRLLIADGPRELTRESIVTGLGQGVDRTGRLAEDAQQRVLAVLRRFKAQIGDAPGTAVMTSAVRDATNGAEFATRVEQALGLHTRILTGEEEAALTFAGATSLRSDHQPVLVIDIGGGSTELVLGTRGTVTWHASTQIGVVRHRERHLHTDPPTRDELAALRADVQLPEHPPAAHAIAVAGTPTQCAAIDLELDQYDAARIEGHILTLDRLQALLDRLSVLPLERLRQTRGIDPARAPVLVGGIAILLEVIESFGLDRVEVSERDILWGLALSTPADTP